MGCVKEAPTVSLLYHKLSYMGLMVDHTAHDTVVNSLLKAQR